MIDMSPIVKVKRFADKKGNRYLSQQGLVTLGEALRKAEAEGENPSALDTMEGRRKSGSAFVQWHRSML
jgi:hypothetical protein